ncbi:MAG: hypothetical protein ACYC1D_18550, partial [Acidimicrobiales bacterium]
ALTNSEARTLAALPSERLEAIVEAAHAHLGDAPPPLADQLRRTAIALRQTHTRHGSATAQRDTAAARAAGAEAARLTRQLARLEHGQALRERWSLTAARLDAQAGAGQAILDVRQAAQQARPYTLLDNATLVRRLRSAQRRAKQARTTAERYDQEGERTTAEIAALVVEIDHSATIGPAQSQARESVIVEQQAATRIAGLQTALAATRLGHHAVRGKHRSQLIAELEQLRRQHPALAGGDPVARWEALLADGKTADRETLAALRSRHDQASTDLDWYRNTAAQLRGDADTQQATIAGIRAELTARTTTPHHPTSSCARGPEPAPRSGSAALLQDQITIAPQPPQDIPG